MWCDGPAARGALGFDDGWGFDFTCFTYDFLGIWEGRVRKLSWCGERWWRWVGRQSWVYVSVIGDCSR